MKVFVAYKHTGENFKDLYKILSVVRDAFNSVGVSVHCAFFDKEVSDEKKLTAREKMNHAFEAIDGGCDMLFVLQASIDKSEGMILEVGYCIAKNIPVIVATKKGIGNTYLPEMGVHSFSWVSPKELGKQIRKYVRDMQEEKTVTITVSSTNWPEDREGYFDFRKFLESHGCTWQEGMGTHCVTFPKT